MKRYECKYCKGVTQIAVLKDTEKGTEPKIEFCPFCGMSSQVSAETEGEESWRRDSYNGRSLEACQS